MAEWRNFKYWTSPCDTEQEGNYYFFLRYPVDIYEYGYDTEEKATTAAKSRIEEIYEQVEAGIL